MGSYKWHKLNSVRWTFITWQKMFCFDLVMTTSCHRWVTSQVKKNKKLLILHMLYIRLPQFHAELSNSRISVLQWHLVEKVHSDTQTVHLIRNKHCWKCCFYTLITLNIIKYLMSHVYAYILQLYSACSLSHTNKLYNVHWDDAQCIKVYRGPFIVQLYLVVIQCITQHTHFIQNAHYCTLINCT